MIGLAAAAIRRPGAFAAAWVVLAAFAAPGLLGLTHDNSPEAYFVRDADALASYRSFRESFRDYGALRVAVSGPGLWSPEGLAWLERFERGAPRIAGVMAAAGPWGRSRDLLGSRPFTEPIVARATLAADPLAASAGIVTRGGEALTVLLALRDLDPGERRRALAELAAMLDERPGDLDVTIAGLATINHALDRELARILGRFFPLVVLLAAAAVALALRSIADTARPLLFSTCCLLVVLGGLGHFGFSFNVVTAALPLLLFVLALATAVHLSIDARERAGEGLGPEAAALATMRHKAWPVLWTAITTGAGFSSLGWSDSPPVRALGLTAAGGIGVVLVAAFTLYPALLARRVPTAGRSRFEQLARRAGGFAAVVSARRRGTVVVLFGLLFVAALAGLPRLRVETGVLDYFRPSHPARAGVEALEALGVGAVTAELFVELEEGGDDAGFAGAARQRQLRGLTSRLRAMPQVLGALSVADLGLEGATIDARTPFLRRARAMLLGPEGASARVSIFLPLSGFTRLQPLFDAALAAAGEELPDARANLTGHYPMVLAAQRRLLATMLVSLALTLGVVAAITAVLARGPRLALAALVPNLFPVAMVLGAMGWLGVALDGATLMVGAVVLGVAADDTLHFLGGLRGGRGGAAIRARATLERVAPAQLLTTLVLISGFLALAGSQFLPVARFGALAAWGLAAALAADWLVVPALTAWAGRRALERFSGS